MAAGGERTGQNQGNKGKRARENGRRAESVAAGRGGKSSEGRRKAGKGSSGPTGYAVLCVKFVTTLASANVAPVFRRWEEQHQPQQQPQPAAACSTSFRKHPGHIHPPSFPHSAPRITSGRGGGGEPSSHSAHPPRAPTPARPRVLLDAALKHRLL